MLTISDSAVAAIRGLLGAVSQQGRTGVRLSGGVASDGSKYELTPSRAPAPGDLTVDRGDVRLYVDPEAATKLEDKLLDAHVRQGALRFEVEDRSG
jgi:iron-sulfur cluster assembly protein